uniref:Uncharacterized protein n=1 Tax=Zonotrichia albicollis TaxID=44394 RepID=A0A8D2MQZ5_ZONAL
MGPEEHFAVQPPSKPSLLYGHKAELPHSSKMCHLPGHQTKVSCEHLSEHCQSTACLVWRLCRASCRKAFLQKAQQVTLQVKATDSYKSQRTARKM